GKAANIYIRRYAVASSHRSTRTAKINSPPGNLRLATNVPQPKSPPCFAIAGSNRFGKTGTKLSAAHEKKRQTSKARTSKANQDPSAISIRVHSWLVLSSDENFPQWGNRRCPRSENDR